MHTRDRRFELLELVATFGDSFPGPTQEILERNLKLGHLYATKKEINADEEQTGVHNHTRPPPSEASTPLLPKKAIAVQQAQSLQQCCPTYSAQPQKSEVNSSCGTSAAVRYYTRRDPSVHSPRPHDLAFLPEGPPSLKPAALARFLPPGVDAVCFVVGGGASRAGVEGAAMAGAGFEVSMRTCRSGSAWKSGRATELDVFRNTPCCRE